MIGLWDLVSTCRVGPVRGLLGEANGMVLRKGLAALGSSVMKRERRTKAGTGGPTEDRSPIKDRNIPVGSGLGGGGLEGTDRMVREGAVVASPQWMEFQLLLPSPLPDLASLFQAQSPPGTATLPVQLALPRRNTLCCSHRPSHHLFRTVAPRLEPSFVLSPNPQFLPTLGSVLAKGLAGPGNGQSCRHVHGRQGDGDTHGITRKHPAQPSCLTWAAQHGTSWKVWGLEQAEVEAGQNPSSPRTAKSPSCGVDLLLLSHPRRRLRPGQRRIQFRAGAGAQGQGEVPSGEEETTGPVWVTQGGPPLYRWEQ